jgi:hypothetical protein
LKKNYLYLISQTLLSHTLIIGERRNWTAARKFFLCVSVLKAEKTRSINRIIKKKERVDYNQHGRIQRPQYSVLAPPANQGQYADQCLKKKVTCLVYPSFFFTKEILPKGPPLFVCTFPYPYPYAIYCSHVLGAVPVPV